MPLHQPNQLCKRQMHRLSMHRPSAPDPPARIARFLAVFAPEPLRSAIEADGIATLRAVCAEARLRRGRVGYATAMAVQTVSLAVAIIRARMGVRVGVSGGGRHTPRPRKDRPVMTKLAHDLRLAVRSLLGAKGPVAIAIATLALGVGVTSAVFSILDALVLRPVPFANSDRLCEIWNFETRSQVSHPGFNRRLLAEWRQQTDLFERFEGYDVTSFVYDTPSGAEMITGAVVTPGLLQMLGARPREGRLFAEGEGRGGTDQVILISETFWSRTLRRDPAAVGQRLGINGRSYSVIGIMPASFRFPNETAAFWMPLDIDAPPTDVQGLPTRLEVLALRRGNVPPERRLQPGQGARRGAQPPRRRSSRTHRDASGVRSADRGKTQAVALRARGRRGIPAADCLRQPREPVVVAHAARARGTTPYGRPWVPREAISCGKRSWSIC